MGASNTQQDKDKSGSLKLSGMSYLLGDAAMFASGMLAQTKLSGHEAGDMRKKAATGLLWGLGGVAAAFYGNPNQEKQLEILAHKLERHLVKSGAEVTDSTRDKTELLRHHSLWDNINRFMFEHPSEALNSVFAVGAATLLMTKDPTKRTIGGLIGAGALAGLLIKEDKDAPAKAANGNPIQKAIAWVQEKPLRVTSAFYLVNNIFTFKDAFNDRKKFGQMKFAAGLKPHYFTFLTAASYVAANSLLFMSPRGQIDGKQYSSEEVAQLEQVAAEIIAAQPKEKRAALLQSVSEFLVKEKSLPLDPQKLAHMLGEHVQTLSQGKEQAPERSWRERVAQPAAEMAIAR